MMETNWMELATDAGSRSLGLFVLTVIVLWALSFRVSKGSRIPLPVLLVLPVALLAGAPFMAPAPTDLSAGAASMEAHETLLRLAALGGWLAGLACALGTLGLGIAGVKSAREYPGWRRSFGVIPLVVVGGGGLLLTLACVSVGIALEAATPLMCVALASVFAAPVAMRTTESDEEQEHLIRIRGAASALVIGAALSATVGVWHFSGAEELAVVRGGGFHAGSLYGVAAHSPLWPGIAALVLACLAALSMSGRALGRITGGPAQGTALISGLMIAAAVGIQVAPIGAHHQARQAWERTDLRAEVSQLTLPEMSGVPGFMEWPVTGDCVWQVEDKAWTVTSLTGVSCVEGDHPIAVEAEGSLLAVPADLSLRSLFHRGKNAQVRLMTKLQGAPVGPLGVATDIRAARVEIASTLLEKRTRKAVLYVVERPGGAARFGDPVDGFRDLEADGERAIRLKTAADGRERIAVIPGPTWTVEDLITICRDAGNADALCTLVPAARAERIVGMSEPSEGASAATREKRVLGAMKLRVLEAALAEAAPQYNPCYLRERAVNRDLAGSVVLSFKIEAEGEVSGVKVLDTELPEKVGACLVDEFSKLALPKPQSGTVLVTWPLDFSRDTSSK